MNFEFRVFINKLPYEAFALYNPNQKEIDNAYREINYVFGMSQPREFYEKETNTKIVDFRYNDLDEIDIEYRKEKWKQPRKKKKVKENKYDN